LIQKEKESCTEQTKMISAISTLDCEVTTYDKTSNI